MKAALTLLVLTKDEESHLARCLASVSGLAEELVVVDSGSTDRTREIAKEYGATVAEHSFTTQAEQVNWALTNVPMRGAWVLRLDADEYLTPELRDEIQAAVTRAPDGVSGFLMKRRVIFMGRWMRHGGYYPTWILRLWRNGSAHCEARAMDEHMILVSGTAARLQNDFVDENLHDLTWWTAKHNSYSSREVQNVVAPGAQSSSGKLGSDVEVRREAKAWYYRLPRFFRAAFYFFYRYVVLLGFLDGVEGLMFHVLQGFWYRFLVDAKLYEFYRGQGSGSVTHENQVH